MKRKNILSALFVLFALSGLSSCMMDFDDAGTTAADDSEIILSLDLPQLDLTRADQEAGNDELNENKINDLHVFIFKAGNENANNVFHQSVNYATGTPKYKLKAKKSIFDQGENYIVYVAANLNITGEGNITTSLASLKKFLSGFWSVSGEANGDHLPHDAADNPSVIDASVNITEGGSLTIDNGNYFILGNGIGDSAQKFFPMSGVSAAMELNTPGVVNIPVTLSRAAAKVRVNLTYGTGFEPSGDGAKATRQLINYAKTGVLFADGPSSYQSRLIDGTSGNVGAVSGNKETIVVYSMPNDWSSDASRETYIWLNVPRDGKNNYYKISLSPNKKLARNHLYDITVAIDKAGSEDLPGAVDLAENSNYSVYDWSEHKLILEVTNIKYLFVRDEHIVMANTTDASTLFYSSSPVTVSSSVTKGQALGTNDKVTFTGTNNGRINIDCAVPTNYMARTITITVSNNDGLSKTVTVVQYPPFSIDESITSKTENGDRNRKIYVVNVNSIDLSVIAKATGANGADSSKEQAYHDYLTGGTAKIGYPVLDNNGCTVQSTDNSRLISPNFMIASQAAGSTNTSDFATAKIKCWSYSETDTDGTTYTDWRLPTYAELRLIDAMQNNSQAAITELVRGNRYWTAYNIHATDKYTSSEMIAASWWSWLNGGTSTDAYVRCVRDIDRK